MTCNKQNAPGGDGSACQGGSGYMCWNQAPWAVSSTLSYGFAARSTSTQVCGACYQLDFHGSGLDGKSMIVQVTNDGGDVGTNAFDLLIPGGGVGKYNACSDQWGTSDLGAIYGGFLTACNGGGASCVQTKCNDLFGPASKYGSKPELLAGCTWFTGWFNAADNPSVTFKQTSCPSAITARSGLSG